ncbi:hypothetical protein WDZ92_48475, partial [Nostoc sp. NIES-2111]
MGDARLSLLLYKVRREGKRPFEFNFAKLGFAFEVARGLRRALEAVMGHTTLATQEKAFMALRKVPAFLGEAGAFGRFPLARDGPPRFSEWLDF